MYSLRPIVTLPAIFPHTDTMYKMRNIVEDKCDDRRRHDANTDAKMPDDVVTEQKPLLCYTTLEIRQEKILNQLAELKEQVSTLCLFLKQSHQIYVKDCAPVQVQKPINIKLILNADPYRPPYSILALQKLWKDTDIRVTSYIHSTINKSIPIIFPSTPKSNAKNTIHLSLIWKKVDDMEVVTGTNNYLIFGEVNFLRYLSRLIDTYNYENICAQPHVLDSILDLTYYLHNTQCKKEGLSIIVEKFEEWSGKDELNIVDIAVWSLIKQFSPPITSKTFKQWYKSCEKTFIDKTLMH